MFIRIYNKLVHQIQVLPSIKQDHGFGRLHTTMPDFVKNIPFWMFMGKVNIFIKMRNNKNNNSATRLNVLICKGKNPVW